MAVDVHAGADGEHGISKTATNAPDEDPSVVGTVGGKHLQVGNELADVLDVVDALLAHDVRGNGSDGERQSLEVFLAAASRHHDFFEHGYGFLARYRVGGKEHAGDDCAYRSPRARSSQHNSPH